ncbi:MULTISPECIES: (Fe-S)-binding protein [Flavobacteriaceae]|uniref:(Fe-S)-binding protein n=2 Tax=Flavobacteriaceae TaxID=49546 RepID=A0A4Y8AQK2_9FLAO|nr:MULTISPECIES: (Fe-S)-binding protein [Flavobacteriaceae]TEW72114.1 (Fe-S)-binding protein [Gramella jeungdoensis]GGK56524.1 Fe-S oxidoreductase [Lutibacter litoralis]
MNYIDNIVFAILLIIGVGFFARNVKKLIRNIKLGKQLDRSDNSTARWKNMAMIALGQSKMVKRPIAGALHIIVYVGFIIINIEVIEIIIDGLFGTHRVLSFLGGFYSFLIASFEILALLVLVSVIVFWIRRMVLKIPRFWNKEMKGFPKNDALYILYFEMVLMSLFLIMNATDVPFQQADAGNPISQFLVPLFENFNAGTLFYIERTAWWLHIAGILVFLNYLYYSKHLHILLAFPNTYFANLNPKGKLNNLEAVTNEVKMMLDPNADPFAAAPEGSEEEIPEKFGASDVADLNWVQLMNAYTCTECGRCTSACPANITGKELSPRAIMMKTRDRLEEVGENINKNGEFKYDGKQLLNDFITPEEIWACTSCNACVEECPINIDPLSIIIDLRRYLVMEQSAASQELNMMMMNIENNGAPWQYNQMDRLNWKDE